VELPLGAICRECRREIERRSGRIGRWVAAAATLGMAAYVLLRLPPVGTGRLVGVIGVAAWYVLTYVVAKRVARELLR
jgi:hypothetical protein